MVKLSRRRVLALTGSMAVGGIALNELSQPAAAESSISFGDFVLPDKTVYPDGTVQNVVLGVDVEYTWTANRQPTKYTVELLVGNTETDLTAIDSIEQTDIPASTTKTDRLHGSLLDSPDYELLNCDVSDGGEKQATVWAKVTFTLYRNDTVMTTAEAMTQATLILKGEDLVVSADIGADGSFGVTDS